MPLTAMSFCTKPGPERKDFLRLVEKNLTGLHRAATSTPSQCEPGLIALAAE